MDMSLEQLMKIPVRAASGFDQSTSEAPSSVTILTAAEIRSFGYRTLAEALASVAGFYISYDRTYDLLGVRGFGRSGDYNTRTLVLIDGVRVNDPIYSTGRIGGDLPIDLALIDRIEIVRGPSSSLYGSNAFFAVINIVTRQPKDAVHTEVSASASSHNTFSGRFSAAREIKNNGSILVSGSLMNSKGPDLYFPQFDSQESNHGVAERLDGERIASLFLRAHYGDWTLQTAHLDRHKQRPTASYGTMFNAENAEDLDRESIVDLAWSHGLSQSWTGSLRMGYQEYRYEGRWPYDYADPGQPPDVAIDRDLATSRTLQAETRLATVSIPRHKLTAGLEVRNSFRVNQSYKALGETVLDSRERQSEIGAYLQDEIQVLPWVRVNAGLRHGRLEPYNDDNLNPRVAAILDPLEGTTFKLIYGTAFRAPNAYERFYNDGGMSTKANPDLKPERIGTYELVWQQTVRDRLQLNLSLYQYDIEDLVSQVLDPSDELMVFQNLDRVEAQGLELEGRMDLPAGWVLRGNYSYSDASDPRTGARLSNSPEHMGRVGLGIPIFARWLSANLEGKYVGERMTVYGETVDSYALMHATLLARRLAGRWDLSFSARNLFDKRFAHPVGAEVEGGVVAQDGRTLRASIMLSF